MSKERPTERDDSAEFAETFTPEAPELAPTASSPSQVNAPHEQIGPYRILQELGAGGMGQVYLAEQREPVHRRVALKIIKAGMDTDQVIARFEAERQALAMMDHVHIAKVLDAGATAEGRPFFVMELVQGTPITRFCDDNKLSIRRRLDVFIDVCRAVQHAHHKGIIHRDLKPSNILVGMVDGEPVPKIIDFGLAKATNQRLTERTMFTAQGQVLGTPEYMSPEQAQLNDLDIDTRTDVFSLGIVLYELLTGSTPLRRETLRNASFLEVLRRVREDEARKPSSRISESTTSLESISSTRRIEPAKLSSIIRGDLDWIVLKAVEKDRNRRYETANGLAADVQRYLSDEPIVARPASLLYRLRKTARRHRGAMATATLMLLLLIVGTVFSTWQAIRATRAEQHAQQRQAQTRQALDAMSSVVISELMASQTTVTPGMRKLLQDALAMYEEFAAEAGEDESTRRGNADAIYNVALIRERLGIDGNGIDDFRQAAARYSNLLNDFPDQIDYALALVRSQHRVSRCLVQAGETRQADTEINETIRIIKEMESTFGDHSALREELCAIGYLQSNHYSKQERWEDAERTLREVITWQRQLIDSTPGQNAGHRSSLATMLQELGVVRRNRDDPEEARSVYREAIGLLTQLESEGPLTSNQQIRLGVIQHGLSLTFYHEGEFAKAEPHAVAALQTRLRGMAQFPNEIDHTACVGASYLLLGNMSRMQGNAEESLPYYTDGIAAMKRVRARDPRYTWANNILQACYRCRAESLIMAQRYAEAIEDHTDLQTLERQLFPQNKSAAPRGQLRQALAMARLQRHDDAIRVVDRVISQAQEHGDDFDRAEAAYYSAAVYAALAERQPNPYKELAMQALARGVRGGCTDCDVKEVHFTQDPDFALLRDTPAFAKLATEHGRK